MFYVRTTKTASSSTAVQIVRYENRKKIIVVHIGSARTEEELLALKKIANEWIEKHERQLKLQLFPLKKQESSSLIALDKCQYLGIRYWFVYDILLKILILFKFHLLDNKLLLDLVIMRLVEPASKSHSLELLEELFDIKHERRNWYRALPILVLQKDKIESKVLRLAKKEFNFDFSLVFYDVTTLYFESFEADELRKPGFSKDNKSNQPQILIGLIVNADGFPVSYEIFEGNRFEGHTLIPIILSFKRKHHIHTLTVVADAAMISQDNIKALKENNLKYIVGARMGNLSSALIQSVSKELNQVDGASIRTQTNHGTIICNFSAKRYNKDKYEMEKQLKKAEEYLKNPSQLKRTKFLKNKGEFSYELNNELIEKTKLLQGIKGYYTNLPKEIPDAAIVNHYHSLWRVEQAFRVAKSDLQMRPIYHFKKQAIEAHVLICFMALAVAKYIEIKTSKSLKSVIKILKTVTDARILNTLTKEEIIMRSEINDEAKQLLQKLGLWY